MNTIPALVLIDRVQILAKFYRERALKEHAKWNELHRKQRGRTSLEKVHASMNAESYDAFAEALEGLIKP